MTKLNLGCGWRNFGSDWVHIDGGDYDHLDYNDITNLELLANIKSNKVKASLFLFSNAPLVSMFP